MRHSYVFRLIVGVVVAMVGCMNVWGEECNYGSTAESDYPIVVNFYVQGKIEKTQTITQGKISGYTPTAICEGKKFMGWVDATTAATYATLQQSAPSYVDLSGTFTESIDLYAVFASMNGGKLTGETHNYNDVVRDMNFENDVLVGKVTSYILTNATIPELKIIRLQAGISISPKSSVTTGLIKDLTQIAVKYTTTGKLEFTIEISTDSSEWVVLRNENLKETKQQTSIVVTLEQIGDYYVRISVSAKVQQPYEADVYSFTFTRANRSYWYSDYSTDCKTAESAKLSYKYPNDAEFCYTATSIGEKYKITDPNFAGYTLDYVEIMGQQYHVGDEYILAHDIQGIAHWTLSTEETEMCVEEWYSNKLLFSEPVALTDISVKINDISQDDKISSVSRKTYSKTYNLYELSGIDFTKAAGQEMQIVMTADAAKKYYSNITIPTFVTSTQQTTPTEGDVVVRDGGILTINDNKTLGVLTIYPNSKVIVQKGVTLTVDALIFFGGIEDENKYGVPELVLNGTIVSTADRILYRMRVDAEQMYTVAFPYDVQVADIRRPDGLAIREGENWTGNLWMSTYNGENRAKGGRRDNNDNNSWKQDAALGETLTAGVGYTVSAPRLRAQSKYAYSLIDFPMAIPMPNEQTEGPATIAAELKSIKGNVGVTFYKNDAVDANNRTDWGWNLLANPYMSTISGGDYRMKVGEKDYDVITMLTDDGEGYYQFVFDGNSEPLRPFKHFFLQVGEDDTFCFYPLLTTSAPRYLTAQEEGSADFALTISGDNTTDISYFRLNNRYTDEYEIGADVVKMCSAPTQLYSLFGEEGLFRMATVAENNKLISLGYQAAMSGSFTFAMAANAAINNVEHIYLLENGDVVADLMNESYTFETSVGTNNDRFAIRIVMRTEQTPTRLGGEEERRIGGGIPPHKRLIEGNVLIVVNGAIYNAEGRKVTK